MIEGCQRLGFQPKPLQPFGIAGDLVREHLDGDAAVELGVPDEEDALHAAAPDFAFHRVPANPSGYSHGVRLISGGQTENGPKTQDVAACCTNTRPPAREAARKIVQVERDLWDAGCVSLRRKPAVQSSACSTSRFKRGKLLQKPHIPFSRRTTCAMDSSSVITF